MVIKVFDMKVGGLNKSLKAFGKGETSEEEVLEKTKISTLVEIPKAEQRLIKQVITASVDIRERDHDEFVP